MAAYATLPNLYSLGMLAVAMGRISEAAQQACLDARNEYADDKMRARYRLPLQAPYPMSLVMNICHLAAWDILQLRGYNPNVEGDKAVAIRGELALKWFDDVERQRAHPAVVEAIGSGDPGYPAPQVLSKPLQGWGPRRSR